MLKKQFILTQTAQQKRYSLIPLITAVIVSLTAASLGAWQLRRADEKRVLAQVRSEAQTGQAINMTGADTHWGAMASKKISVRGKFENERTIYIDNRGYQGKAGFHVVTPLVLEGSNQRLAVLRGWVERNLQDRNKLPSLPEIANTIEVNGLVQGTLGKSFDLEKLGYADPAEMKVPEQTQRLWQQFDPKPYGQWVGASMLPVILRQFSATDDGLVRDWARPADEVAKHHGYAVQWFALSGLAVVLWFYFSVIRPRRFMRLEAAQRFQ